MSSDPVDIVSVLEAEQRRLTFARFTNADAWQLGSALVAMAAEEDAAVTIDVRRPGQILFHCARAGTTADNDNWIARKSRTAFHFQESSWLVRQRFLARGAAFEADSGLDPLRYAAHGGAFPIAVEDSGVVAVVTVSGLPQEEDHRLVVAGLTALATSR